MIEAEAFITRQSVWRWAILTLLILAGLIVRMYHITDPPLGFHPARQYRSALIARDYYYRSLDSLPEWRREVARVNREIAGQIEPPVMEWLAAQGYRLVGSEQLWIPRVLSALFWVIGGVFLFLLTERLLTTDAAVFVTAFYLLLPYGISASRSFQPDSLMIVLLLISLYLIVRFFEKPALTWLVAAAIVAALSFLVKPVGVFFVFGAFGMLALDRFDRRKALQHSLLFAAISLLPALIYYVNGLFLAGFMRNQTQVQFLPRLLVMREYWVGWFLRIKVTLGYTALIGALLGFLSVRTQPARSLLRGLWLGYLIFGLVFNYAIHTHDYYQLPLIPLVAISLSPLAALIGHHLMGVYPTPRLRALLVAGLLAIFTVERLIDTRWGFNIYELPDTTIIEIAPEIGRHVGHSTHVMALSPAYAVPLFYYGEMAGLSWPGEIDFRVAELRGSPLPPIEQLIDPQADYFVVTDLVEFERQADLRNHLLAHYPLIAQTDGYLIFDLQPELE